MSLVDIAQPRGCRITAATHSGLVMGHNFDTYQDCAGEVGRPTWQLASAAMTFGC
jgi:hypothetical protein